MDLELTADAEVIAGLPRLRSLSACREGRPRTQSVRIVWHDSPDHGLLAAGTILAERRSGWRLERIIPGPQTWLPGQPPPVVIDSPDLSEMPSPLAPLAAFEGRRAISVHRFGAETVTLGVEKGMVRAVTSEHPSARLWLSGEDHAVKAAATLIATALAVSVPLTSLAADGIAAATGQGAGPRHEGTPVLPGAALSVADAFAHILGHLVDVLLVNAAAACRPDATGADAVHQMRVAVRRARSAVSIFQPALPAHVVDEVTALLKVLGARLGPTRDWDVFVDETAPAMRAALANDERLPRMIAAAGKRRRECRNALAAYLGGVEFRLLGVHLAWFAAARFWHPVESDPADWVAPAPPSLGVFAAGVLQHRWKKLVSSGKRIDRLDIPALHAVRLRAKRVRYAAEMFATLYQGKAPHRFIRRLSVLQQRLGVLNDGAVAAHLMAELGGPAGRHAYAAGIVTGFQAARAEKIRPGIIRAFERFRRQQPYWT